MAGLMRRAREGGSWHVRVALARTGQWLQDLGPLEGGFDCQDPGLEDVGDSMVPISPASSAEQTEP